MNPRLRVILRTLFVLFLAVLLFRLFPRALAFTEMAARELRYFWWLILLIALGCWLIWGFKRRR